MNKLYDDHQLRSPDGVPIGNIVFDFGKSLYLSETEKENETSEQYKQRMKGLVGESKRDKEKRKNQEIYEYIVYAESYYRDILYKLSKEVLGKRINPHQFRHAKAMDMLNHGVPIDSIKEFLGHSSIVSTEVYARASSQKIKSDYTKYLEIKKKPNIVDKPPVSEGDQGGKNDYSGEYGGAENEK